MEEIKTLQIDDTSFECQTLIQFSSLIKLLYKLNEKEKTLEQKIDNINQTINEKEIRIKNLEIKLEEQQPKFDEIKIGQSFMSSPNITQNIIKSEKYESPRDMNKQSSELEDKKEFFNIALNEAKIEEKSEEKINKEENEKIEEKNEEKEKMEIKEDKKEKGEIKEDKKEKIEKIKNFDIIKEEKKLSHETDSSRNTVSPDLIKNLVKRTKESEKRIMDLIKKTNEHIPLSQNIKKNNELINKNSKSILDNQNSINEILNNLSKLQREFEEMKIKMQDFNIIDILKSNDGTSSGNMDLSKALIMNLENKVFKKFELYDERYKSYDTDIFKLKEDNKNLNNSINSIKTQQQKYIEDIQSTINELNINLTNEINELKNQITEIQNELNEIKKNEKEKNNLINNIDTKIKQTEEAMKEIIKKELEQNNKNIKENLINKISDNNKSNTEDDEKIKNIEKKLNEFLKKIISLENLINSQKDNLQSMQEENLNKFTKLESLNNLKDKINLLEEELNSDSLKFNTLQQGYEKTRSDMLNLVHKIEYVNSELTRLTLQKLSSSNDKPEITIDFSKYLEKDEFINNKKEINNKFEKVRLAIENLGRNIESILTTLG